METSLTLSALVNGNVIMRVRLNEQETASYRVLQKWLYNFESLYKFTQRSCTVF
jgi:hypothetical protein